MGILLGNNLLWDVSWLCLYVNMGLVWVPWQVEKQKTIQLFLNSFSQNLHVSLLLDSYQSHQVTWLPLTSSSQENLPITWVWKEQYWWVVIVTTIVCPFNAPKFHLTVGRDSKTRFLGEHHDCFYMKSRCGCS